MNDGARDEINQSALNLYPLDGITCENQQYVTYYYTVIQHTINYCSVKFIIYFIIYLLYILVEYIFYI